jgi:GDP-L-fucose synthase
MDKQSKILIVGHNDIIERSLTTYFQKSGYSHIFSSSEIALNPIIQPSVYEFFQKYRPDYVFLGSTKSGGIEANIKHSAEFIYHNLESQNNIVYASHMFGVKKLLYFAGSCIYPKVCPQPIKEEHLLTAPLESTSEAYSIAKIAGLRLCQHFCRQHKANNIIAIPATIYGPGSDVDLETAHVIGALIGKFAKAVKENQKEVIVWGTGTPRREFLYADDFVDACLFLMEKYEEEQQIHVGCGYDVSIKELADIIADVSGFKGKIILDASKPDGTMQKLLDNSRITNMGWKAKTSLKEGIQKTYQWYLNNGVKK